MLQRLQDLARQETLALQKGLLREQPDVQADYANDPLAHIARLSDGDPTPFKRLTKAIVRWHGRGALLLEDLYKVRDDLEIFERIQPTLPVSQRDLMRYKTPYDLYELVKPYQQLEQPLPVSSKEKERDHAAAMRAQSEILYEGPEGLIVIPNTREASSYWGRGTRWCTATTKETLYNSNRFEAYNWRGPLMTIVLRDGQKFQYHAKSKQIQDAEDQAIAASKLIQIAPFTQKSARAMAHLWVANDKGDDLHVEQTPAFNLEAVKINGHMLRYIENQTDEVCKAAIVNNSLALKYVRKQTLGLCEFAVGRDPEVLEHAFYQTFDMCERAVQSYNGAYAGVRVNVPYFVAKCFTSQGQSGSALWLSDEQQSLLADYKNLPCSSYSGDTLLDSLRQSPCHHDSCDCLQKLGWKAKTNEKVMDLTPDELDDIRQRLFEAARDATEVGAAIHALKANGEIFKRFHMRQLQVVSGVRQMNDAMAALEGVGI